MTNVFKKMVLSVAMLGSIVGNVHTADNRKSTASDGAMALATGAMITGAAGMVVGATGIIAQMSAAELGQNLPSSVSQQILSISPYAILVVPGVILAAGAAIYSFKSAKGVWAKIRSISGSSATIAGGALLTVGCIGYLGAIAFNKVGFTDALWGATRPTQNEINQFIIASGLAVAGGTGLSLLGYAIQPTDKS